MKMAQRMMKANQFTAPELIEATFKNIEDKADLNAYVNVRNRDEAMKEAEAAQKRIEKDQPLSKVDGIPLAIKDNILTKGLQSSAASVILEGFIAPIDSTAVKKLRDGGAIVVGAANMDEFGMGSWGMYGYAGKMVKNPID